MGYRKITLGADRFLALKWANFAFELFQTNENEDFLYQSLQTYLDSEIEGEETSRKTSNHLKRLWLTKEDRYQPLRLAALELLISTHPEFLHILHLGLAMNIFPLYRETQKAIGVLDRIINPIPKLSIVDRVLETFGNTSSIPRAVARVLQTLEDWGFITNPDNYVTTNKIVLQNDQIAEWFIRALVTLSGPVGITLSDISFVPEKLGVSLPNPRQIIQSSTALVITYNLSGFEMIAIKK